MIYPNISTVTIAAMKNCGDSHIIKATRKSMFNSVVFIEIILKVVEYEVLAAVVVKSSLWDITSLS
jgi:DNA-directed RNA polymerase subunit E'/Rpb7